MIKRSFSIVFGLLLVALFSLVTPAGRVCAAEYDFAGVGTASGGFKPQGNRFLVSDKFENDEAPNTTAIWYNNVSASDPKTVNGMIIKADGTNLTSFNLTDMKFTIYAAASSAEDISSLTITGTKVGGGTVSVTVNPPSTAAGASFTLLGLSPTPDLSGFTDITQLTFDITTNNAVYNIDFSTITLANEVYPTIDPPTTQATNAQAVVIGSTELILGWTSGNGGSRVVFAKAGATTGGPSLVNSTTYAANSDFSLATDPDSDGWKCVYNGNGGFAPVSGLTATTQYRFVVFEYNGSSGNEKYLTTGASNASNETTIGSLGAWTRGDITGLDGTQNFWSWTDADRDSGGNTYVGHRYNYNADVNSQYRVEKWDGSGWTTPLASFTAQSAGYDSFSDSSSTAVTGSNQVRMLIKGNKSGSGTITEAKFDGSVWSFSDVDTTSATNTSFYVPVLAVAGNGNSHVLYEYNDANSRNQYIKLASWNGSGWASQTLVTISNDNDVNNGVKNDYLLLNDASNKQHVFYIRMTTTGMDLHHWTNGTSPATDTTIFTGNTNSPYKLYGAIDSNGKFHVTYGEDALFGRKVMYLTDKSGSWVSQPLLISTAGWQKGFAPLELRINGNGDMVIPVRSSADKVFKALLKKGSDPWKISVLSPVDALTDDWEDTGFSYNSTGVTFREDGKAMIVFANGLSARPRRLMYTMVSLTPPTVTGISPDSGPTAGGTNVTISGTGFENGATVTIGGGSASGVTWNSATSISATTPAGTAGAKNVVVTNPDTQTGTLTNGFTYIANIAPTFVGAVTTLTVNQNASATDIKGLLHVSDTDSSQTETWTESVAPNHGGALTITSATASTGTGSTDITPGGTITYQPANGYSGTETFTVQVSDGIATATRTITVTINPIYTVTYNGNSNTGGTAPSDGSSPYVAGSTVTVLGNTGSLTRTGYTFSGWNTAANGSGTSYAPAATFSISGTTTLYAKWTGTVTYSGNGNSGGSAPTDATAYLPGATVTASANSGGLTKTGYNFSGWNTLADGTGTTYTAGSGTFAMSGDITLYARWTASVTYNGNSNTGGSVPTDVTAYLAGATVTVLGNTGTLTRTGFTFAGWNTQANGSGTNYSAADTFAISGNVTLYAKWTATVTYNGNGNTGGTAPTDGSSPYVAGATVTVLGNTGSLVRTGYTFTGWNTAADGSGTSYAPAATFSISGNTTLYAKWTGTVTYDGNGSTGGTVPIDASGYLPGATVTAAANSGGLTKTGYNFSGWNTLADGTGTTYTAGSGTFAMSGDITLYARWTASITYNGNSNTGGSVPTDASAYLAGATVTVLGNTGSLIRTGSTFSGWNTQANGSGTNYSATDTFTITGNVTLYAKWTATVTYDGNSNTGGSAPTDGSSPYVTGYTVTVLGNTGSLVRTGYTFTGWNTAADGSGTAYAPSATFSIAGNTTLYAKWLAAPVATAASTITFSGFTAKWNSATGATGYYLDVATDNGFTSFVAGFNNLDVGNVTSKAVTGLVSSTPYYYRVRAYDTGGASANSNTINPTTATTRIVTNNSDNDPGSLRQTIAAANPGDAITFDSSLNGQTITLSSQITIDKELTINGPGAANLTISGGGSVRIFEVNAGKTIRIAGLTLASGSWFDGPALFNRGILTVSNVLITGNHAVASSGSGIYNETGATLTVSGCTISGNIADAFGGGVYNDIGSTATISNTTITGNTASTGSGIYNNLLSNLTVENCTISGNSAVGVFNDDTALIRNSILWGNGGSEIYNGDTITVTNSIVQGGYAGAGNLNADPLLGPLADNGGQTMTMMLLSGSPAIDAGNCATGPAADQRGMARPQDDTCDMGAYERGAPAAVTTDSGTPQATAISTAFGTALSAKVTDSLGGALDGISVAFAGPGSGADIAAGSSINTASSGIAAFSATANAIAGGPYTVTATVGSLSANFSLTNSKADQFIVFDPAPSIVVDGTGTVSATGGLSGNAVTFSTATPGCSVSGSTVTGLLAGTNNCTIDANQLGNANYNSALQVSQTFSIGKGTPIITVTPGTYTYNGSAQGPVAADVNTGGSTGGVTMSYSGTGGTVYGPSATPPTNAGTYTATATVATDSNYVLASSADTAFSISRATPTITVTTGTYTYNGSPQGPVAADVNTGGSTGAVTMSYSGSGATVYGPSATLPTAAGAYTATATVAADSNYVLASSAATAFSIGKAAQVITFNPPASATYGAPPITLSATGGISGNPVTFAYVSGPGSLLGTTLFIAGAGDIVVTASQLGNANYNDATTVQRTITVNKATATVTLTTASLSATYDGTAKAAAATTTPSGLTVNFTYNGSSTAPTSAGNYTVAAVVSDSNYQGSATGTLTIGRASTTTAITTHTPDPSNVGQAATVSFNVTSSAGTPTGNVTVSDGVDSCTGTVASGSCSLTLTTSGARTLTATYAGDANFGGSTSAGVSHTVRNLYALTVKTKGTGSGTVTSSPSGINCGSDCTETYNQDTAVTLTASPSEWSEFAGWSGPCTGTAPCTVTMTSAKSVTATFNFKKPYAVAYTALSAPVLSSVPDDARPIGMGTVAEGGDTLSVQLGLGAYTDPVDLYLVIYAPDMDPASHYILRSDDSLHPLSEGVRPWKTNVSGDVTESLFGDIPVSLLPPGSYGIYLMATPAGSTDTYHLWLTSFEVTDPAASIPLPSSAGVIYGYEAPAFHYRTDDPLPAFPMGIGSFAVNGRDLGLSLTESSGDTLNIRIGLDAFAAPVDLYFGIYAPAADPENIYLLGHDGAVHRHTEVFMPWKPRHTGPLTEDVFGGIPASLLPAGDYYLYLMATPAGSLGHYYLWSTVVTVK